VVVIAGCGGGSSSSSSEATSEGEPSAQFIKQKSDRRFAAFGTEASAEEREAANEVVTENLKAREAADFETQCATLNHKAIAKIPGAKNEKGCPKALKKIAEPLSGSKELRKDTLSGSIAVLRVKGNEGFALYHGNDGKNWAVPLEKENGSWKVGALIMIEL
jgi:hypothetical protein